MGVLRYGFGLKKQVGTNNHSFDSKISLNWLIFWLQVEEKSCYILFFFIYKIISLFFLKQEKKYFLHVCNFCEAHFNSKN